MSELSIQDTKNIAFVHQALGTLQCLSDRGGGGGGGGGVQRITEPAISKI